MSIPTPSMMPKRAPQPTSPVALPSEVETESSVPAEEVVRDPRQKRRPSLKPIPGHVVRFEEVEGRPGTWVGTCSCKALVKVRYMDLVRHVKNVRAEMAEAQENATEKPKPKGSKPRRTGIPNRPLQAHSGLEKLYGDLSEGPKGRVNTKKRGR